MINYRAPVPRNDDMSEFMRLSEAAAKRWVGSVDHDPHLFSRDLEIEAYTINP